MDMCLTPATVLAIQEAAEAFLVRLFEDTNLVHNTRKVCYNNAEGHEAGSSEFGGY